MDPVNLQLTCRNNNLDPKKVAKRFDLFLVFEVLMDHFVFIKQWFGVGCDLNHSPIFLELKGATHKLACPFKMNSNWLKDEAFMEMVQAQ